MGARKQSGVLLLALAVEGVMLSMLWQIDLIHCAVGTLLVALVLQLTTSIPSNLWWRSRLMSRGAVHFVLSSEKKGLKRMPDPKLLLSCEKKQTKTIIFIRHGESDWNEMFNKGFWPISFAFRVLRGLVRELLLFAATDSVFYDSPLSQEGIDQARKLKDWLGNEGSTRGQSERVVRLFSVLNQGPAESNSIICSSNLRRALATTTIGLWGRLKRTREKVWVLSQLQEMSRNVDTIALAGAGSTPRLPVLERELGPSFASGQAEQWFDNTQNKGNKSCRRTGADSLMAFAKWACNERKEEVIVVGGHSLWFRTFFRQFLPRDRDHKAKKKKMKNAGAVSFDLQYGTTSGGNQVFRIEPDSVEVVYDGFKE